MLLFTTCPVPNSSTPSITKTLFDMALRFERATFLAFLLVTLVCIVSSKAIHGKKTRFEPDEDKQGLFVWRVVSVSEYENGSPVKPSLHYQNGLLPTCAQNHTKHHFTSEVCMTLKSSDAQDTTSIGFQHCDCPDGSSPCSRSFEPDDPYTYAAIDDMQLKTCIPKSHIPVCTAANKRRRGGVVAKLWYGEELPQRVLLHCRCPRGYVWGHLQCTSSGRICYVMGCEKS